MRWGFRCVVPDPVPGISPIFAFPSGLLQYLALYVSVSHVCCACRLLERTASQRHQNDKIRHQSQETWRDLVWVWQLKRCLKYVYSPCLVAVLTALLFSPDFYPRHTGDFACFPCRCNMGHLQSCGLAAQLQQQQLALTNLTGIDQNVFKPLGCQVSQLSLANSSLFQLTSKCFKDLPCLRILDLGRAKLRSLHEDSFFGLKKLKVLSLSQNELAQISVAHLSYLPSLEQLLLGNKLGFDGEKLFEVQGGNSIELLPRRFLQGNPNLKVLDIGGNEIHRLHQDTFLEATHLEVLDINANQLHVLPEGIFAGLSKLQVVPRQQHAEYTS